MRLLGLLWVCMIGGSLPGCGEAAGEDCGADGEDCCAGALACDPGLACDSTSGPRGVCASCASLGATCCDDERGEWCLPDEVALGCGPAGTCVLCGDEGEACCTRPNVGGVALECGSELSCVDGVCEAMSAPDAGMADAGVADAGPSDAGGADAGSMADAGSDAGGPPDAGFPMCTPAGLPCGPALVPCCEPLGCVPSTGGARVCGVPPAP